jgi:glycosyltransferase involved in cell wall biosynthesis
MRIAVWHNLPSGGGKRALWDHVTGLLKRGHFVESWCPSTASQEFLPLSKLCTEHVLPFNGQSHLKGARGLWRLQNEMDSHCLECAQQIHGKGFDVLFANSCSFFAAPPIARHVQIPSVLYLGEPHREFYEALPKLMWLTMTEAGGGLRKFRSARFLANFVRIHAMRTQAQTEISNAEAFDQILVNSLYSRESVLRAYGLESHVCYLGVDSERFSPSEELKGDYIIGLGTLHYHKGLDRALKAIGAIPISKRPKLLWVGNSQSPSYLTDLHRLARSLNVKFETKLMVSDDELVSLLRRSNAMLYTSRLEPFGFAPLEANACGIPVVAIAEGGVRESIEHGQNGLLVPDANPDRLASALVTILTNRPLARELGLRAREIVISRWSLDASVSRLEQALLQRIETSRRLSDQPRHPLNETTSDV